jgi:hypothetical protein
MRKVGIAKAVKSFVITGGNSSLTAGYEAHTIKNPG